MTSFAKTRYGDEPETPRWVEWRLAIYPLALLSGALALAFTETAIRLAMLGVFVVLMLLPLAIKAQSWGGLGRLLRWLFLEKRLEVSREGWVFLVLTVMFGVAAINTGTNLLYLVLSMLLSLIVISGMMSEIDLKGLKLARGLPQQIFAGEQVRFRLQVQNPRRLIPSFALMVREMDLDRGDGAKAPGPVQFVSRLRPGEMATCTYTTSFARRGVYPLSGFILATRFPFGFFTKFAKADLAREVVVFPTPLPLTPAAVGELGRSAESLRARSRSYHPDEFRSLRPYRPGDNPRWIHWRSSARAGSLVVK
jgi:uncharacterized protein (DUF58 family)